MILWIVCELWLTCEELDFHDTRVGIKYKRSKNLNLHELISSTCGVDGLWIMQNPQKDEMDNIFSFSTTLTNNINPN